MEITKNALENLMLIYVDHKKMMIEYENRNLTDCEDYGFRKGCCNTAENWMRAVGVSPYCNFIEERLYG